MLRIILAMVLMAIVNFGLTLPANTKPFMSASLSKGGQGLVPKMVEYARASGTPTGPKAPGGAYCYAPIDAKGRLDFDATRAYGSVTRAIALTDVTLKANTNKQASRLGLQGGKQALTLSAAHNADSAFFAHPVTAEEFCTLAQEEFTAQDVALNLW